MQQSIEMHVEGNHLKSIDKKKKKKQKKITRITTAIKQPVSIMILFML